MAAGDPHYLLYAIQHAIPLVWHYAMVLGAICGITEFGHRWLGA